jgi:hypothetical protein
VEGQVSSEEHDGAVEHVEYHFEERVGLQQGQCLAKDLGFDHCGYLNELMASVPSRLQEIKNDGLTTHY